MPSKHISSIFRLEHLNKNYIIYFWRWKDIREEENGRVSTSAVTSDIYFRLDRVREWDSSDVR